jgi:hypothetical protein
LSSFSASWLSLREPADTAARAASIATLLVEELARRQSPARIVDLGTGTGANFRFLAPRLGGSQEWLLVDEDPSLLSELSAKTHAWCASEICSVSDYDSRMFVHGEHWQCRVEARRIDLAAGLDALELSTGAVVTASALLDLVSDSWLTTLINKCYASNAIVLFALSYDGRMTLTPPEADDEWTRGLVNRHQRGNKGFGDALGPDATTRARNLLTDLGYEVSCAPSDWKLEPSDRDLQQQLLEGWAHAALEMAPEHATRVRSWLARRLAHVATGDSRITVGHQDLIGWLP